MKTDAGTYPPPYEGPNGYNSFQPPPAGASYYDVVFETTVRRLTNEVGREVQNDIYSKNGFWNSDGSRFWHHGSGGNVILNTTSGAVIRSNVPGNFDGSFAPDNPDLWYYFDIDRVMAYNVTTAQSTAIKKFASRLGPLGGSVDWVSSSGRFMVLNVGGQARVWDKPLDVLYAGAIPGNPGDGWVGISPDGKFVVTAVGAQIPGVGQPIRSYAVDHDAKRVSTTGVMFWSLCGAHGDLVSASNGRTYLVTTECYSEAGVWAADVTIPQSVTPAGIAKQHADARRLVALDWIDNDVHISASGDWAYISTESSDDPHGAISSWRPFKQEILRVNVVTGELQRLAHHRSRGLGGGENYRWQPRVCCSWDGTRVAWASNMGSAVANYSDIYTCTVSVAVPPPVPPPPAPKKQTIQISGDVDEVLVDGVSVFRRVV
jgi:hypothetical protein